MTQPFNAVYEIDRLLVIAVNPKPPFPPNQLLSQIE